MRLAAAGTNPDVTHLAPPLLGSRYSGATAVRPAITRGVIIKLSRRRRVSSYYYDLPLKLLLCDSALPTATATTISIPTTTTRPNALGAMSSLPGVQHIVLVNPLLRPAVVPVVPNLGPLPHRSSPAKAASASRP